MFTIESRKTVIDPMQRRLRLAKLFAIFEADFEPKEKAIVVSQVSQAQDISLANTPQVKIKNL